jgi:hypothetical protein
MGLFKQVKDTRNILRETPNMLMQARDLAAQAQAFQAVQALHGATTPGAAGVPMSDDELQPIAGISLERYAQLAKTIGSERLSGDALESYLGAHGHTEGDWQHAYEGWNARMKANMALSTQFGVMYQRAVATKAA